MTDSWGERHQSALYLTSMAVGVVLSLMCPPKVSEVSDALVPYALAVLLLLTLWELLSVGARNGNETGYPLPHRADLPYG